jgi:fructoselysine-6-P-deglycase FrlB-like protein
VSTDLIPGIDRAIAGDFFTAKVLEEDLARVLREQRGVMADLVTRLRAAGIERIYFVGCGGSYALLYSGEYLFERFTRLPAKALTAYEFVGRAEEAVNERTLVVLASYSGETEDAVSAVRFASSRGAITLSFTKTDENTMARESTYDVPYHSIALYAAPLLLLYLFCLEWAACDGNSTARQVLETIDSLPATLGRLYRDSEETGREHALQLRDATMLYVIAAGSLFGLGYKFALTVFMENIRIHGSIIHSAEFRHGPNEVLDRNMAPMVFLLADDEQREITERVLRFVQNEGVPTVVYDAAQVRGLHPLLAPFALLIPLEWLTVYSCALRGITDLDERVYMGKGILAKPGIIWP